MDRILYYLRPLLGYNYTHPYRVLGVALVLGVITAWFAVQLRVDTDLTNLLPRDNEHVQALNELQQTVGGETPMEVVIQSPDFDANLAFARDLIQESLKLYNPGTDNYFFERAEFRKNVEVIKDNALYFATPTELEDITEYLREEIQRVNEELNPFYLDLDEEDDEDPEQQQRMDRFEESYDALIPSEYPISADSTIMVVRFFPTGSKSNLSFLRSLFSEYDSLLTSLDITGYHEEMEVEYGGRLKRHLEEIDSIMGDVFRSFASGISTVIILVMIYFFVKKYVHYRRGSSRRQEHGIFSHLLRMPVPVLIIGIPLLISLSWTFGITYGVLGMLNTMTSVLFVILFGMGIDYGIHFYARYIEFRSAGLDIKTSLYSTYDKTGAAIVVSGLTTAFSLYVLVLAQFRGFSEFGFIAGTGIILALFCMLFILPSLLVIFERFNWILLNEREAVETSHVSSSRFPFARTLLVVGLAAAALVLFRTDALRFQYDFGELEPEFPEYEAFRQIAGQVSDSPKRNPAYILADTQEETIQILEILRHRMRTDTTSPTILDVEALPERFPANEAVAEDKLQDISRIRELLSDPVIQGQDDPQLERLRRAAQTTEPLDMEDIPDYFKNQFMTRSGEMGNFVIVYPSVGLSDGENSIAFKHDVGAVTLDNGKTFHAASTSIIAAEMLELMRDESPWMIGATFLMVFLLMRLSFHSFRWTVIAMLPLIVGLLWLFGIMVLTGIMFNFYNLVVLPAILGIGEDNGVHLAARYREEGRNSMWDVLSSTGQHVTIGSLTTILGFSGLLFTNHPGLQSIGIMAVLGIGMTLVAALFFLPALIQWLEDRNWIRFG